MSEAYTGPTQLMIGGQWVDGVKGQTIDVLNPFNATKITAIAEATEEDVDLAVAAAKAAFPAWAKMAAIFAMVAWVYPSRAVRQVSFCGIRLPVVTSKRAAISPLCAVVLGFLK